VLVDKDRTRAKAVATNMHYGAPLSPIVAIKDGDYDDLAGAGLAIMTAGINEKAGGATDRNDPAGRLRLLDTNVKVFEDVVPRLVKVAPEAVILKVHPVELAHVWMIRNFSRPSKRLHAPASPAAAFRSARSSKPPDARGKDRLPSGR
jgi:malate/lactate dehydrogenase